MVPIRNAVLLLTTLAISSASVSAQTVQRSAQIPKTVILPSYGGYKPSSNAFSGLSNPYGASIPNYSNYNPYNSAFSFNSNPYAFSNPNPYYGSGFAVPPSFPFNAGFNNFNNSGLNFGYNPFNFGLNNNPFNNGFNVNPFNNPFAFMR
ncbi:MAG: hypothetical protein U0744_11220 [Gemmataceae bacterium]